ncbi:MAG: hypothetical protein WHT08_18395 [Bryobacteraceae bacterium]
MGGEGEQIAEGFFHSWACPQRLPVAENGVAAVAERLEDYAQAVPCLCGVWIKFQGAPQATDRILDAVFREVFQRGHMPLFRAAAG